MDPSALDEAREALALRLAAEFLLTEWRSRLHRHVGTLLGTSKTAPFFRGQRAIKVLTSEAYARARAEPPSVLDQTLELVNTWGRRVRTAPDAPPMPAVADEADARVLLTRMLRQRLIVKCERFKKAGEGEDEGARVIRLLPPAEGTSVVFADDEYYAWTIPEPQRWATVIALGILLAVFVVMLFPLWPYPLRVAVSYAATGLAGLLIAFLVAVFTVRPAVWWVSKFVAPPGLWILPNVNEDIGFFDSFKPLWSFGSWEHPDPARVKASKRTAAAAAAAEDEAAPASVSALASSLSKKAQ